MKYLSHLIIGISGVSGGGKTTVAKLLRATFPWASIVHQDNYYYPPDSKRHVIIPNLNHNNWELKTALDFPGMTRDLNRILCDAKQAKSQKTDLETCLRKLDENTRFFKDDGLLTNNAPSNELVRDIFTQFSSVPMLIMEGHILFNHKPFYDLCDFRYFLTLGEEECRARRLERVYDPPNPVGFFDQVVWPAHVQRLWKLQGLSNIEYLDAENVPVRDIYCVIRDQILKSLERLCVTPPKVRQRKSLLPR